MERPQVDKALDERTIGHNPERLSLMKVRSVTSVSARCAPDVTPSTSARCGAHIARKIRK